MRGDQERSDLREADRPSDEAPAFKSGQRAAASNAGRGMSAAASSRPEETEGLAGLVERVTFHSQESGFCVLRVKARGHRDLVTVVGQAAMISAGEWITASGAWSNDSTHGLQFRARFVNGGAISGQRAGQERGEQRSGTPR